MIIIAANTGAHLTFGAKRFEVVGGFVNAVLLLRYKNTSHHIALSLLRSRFYIQKGRFTKTGLGRTWEKSRKKNGGFL